MKLYDIFKKAFNFGTNASTDNIVSFTIKILIYIIPAVILGHYTDQIIQTIRNHKLLGNNIMNYIIIQLFINIVILYILVHYLSNFASEFQRSTAGGYFIVLYFGMQTNYIHLLKEHMLS